MSDPTSILETDPFTSSRVQRTALGCLSTVPQRRIRKRVHRGRRPLPPNAGSVTAAAEAAERAAIVRLWESSRAASTKGSRSAVQRAF